MAVPALLIDRRVRPEWMDRREIANGLRHLATLEVRAISDRSPGRRAGDHDRASARAAG